MSSGRHRAFSDPGQGATWGEIADPGNGGTISVTRSGVCNLVSVGADETRTLPAPAWVGQSVVLCMQTDGGDIVVTAPTQGVNSTNESTMTFQNPLEAHWLMGVLVNLVNGSSARGTIQWMAVTGEAANSAGITA